MQNEDDLRGLAKVTDFMRAISFLFMAFYFYWFYYCLLNFLCLPFGLVSLVLSYF